MDTHPINHLNFTSEVRKYPNNPPSSNQIQSQSKKIHKAFHINSKSFHEILTKKSETVSPLSLSKVNMMEIGKKLSRLLEKINKQHIFFPAHIMSYIYTLLKNPNGFSSQIIEDLVYIQQNQKPLPAYIMEFNEPMKIFEKPWLDFKISKDFTTNDRMIKMTNKNSFENLAKIVKIEPRKLEGFFFQCNGNISVFNEFLRSKDRKLLWSNVEDRVLKTGKDNNPLAYELLTYCKGNERKLFEREAFLKETKNSIDS